MISFVFFLVLALGASAYSVTYKFYDLSTGQALNHVDVRVYPCLDSACRTVDLNQLLTGSGNSGSATSITITYPSTKITSYGYADYQSHPGYIMMEYLDTFWGTGSASYNTDFYKKQSCVSPVDITRMEQDSNGNRRIVANVQSAFHEANSLINFVPPGYEDYYSALVDVTFEIYTQSGSRVFTQTTPRNIFMDTTETLYSNYFMLSPGTYNAVVRTAVTDDQCGSNVPAEDSYGFTIQGPAPQCSDGIDNDGDGLIDMADPGCSSPLDNDETNVAPVNNPPVVNLMNPPNGTTITVTVPDNPVYFTYNVTDGISNVLNCTIYTNLTGNFQPGYSQLTPNNTIDFFVMLVNAPDGIYIWNVKCSDGQLSAFAHANYTFIVNETNIVILPLNVNLAAVPTSGVEPLNVTFNCSVSDGTRPFSFDFDSGDSSGSSYTVAGPRRARSQLFYVYNYDAGIYNATCNVTDNNGRNGADSVLINATSRPVDTMPPTVNLISPPNGTVTNNQNMTFVFNVTDDLSNLVNCSLLINNTIRLYTTFNNNITGSFPLNNLADGTYLWNIVCVDESNNSGRAPYDFVFTINTSLPYVPECSDGVDNDGDGLIDFPVDPGCANVTDDDEFNFICTNHLNISRVEMSSVEIIEGLTYPANSMDVNNGILPFDYWFTNNGSFIFFVNYTTTMASQATGNIISDTSTTPLIPANTTQLESENLNVIGITNGTYNLSVSVEGIDQNGCYQYDMFNFFAVVNTSVPSYECSDGYDNDNDTFTDAADPGCYDTGSYNPFDNNETDTLPECSDYFDNDNDGLIDLNDPGCTNQSDNDETDINATNQPPVVQLIFPFDNLTLGINDVGFIYGVTDDNSTFVDCTLYVNISGNFTAMQTQTIFAGLFGLFNVNDVPNGVYEWNVLCSDGSLSAFAPANFTFTINTSAQTYVCSDGVDNDGDGLIDMADPGCSSPQDDNESNTVTLPQCSDGIDNDGDGLIDLADPDCQNSSDNDEASEGTQPGGDEDVEILDPEQILYIGHIDVHSTTNTGYEQEVADVGDELEVSVYIENIAPYNLEELKLTVYIDELGVWRTIGPFDLAEGEHTVKHIYLDIPVDAEPGYYNIRIVVQNSDLKRVKYRGVYLL